ncbi:Holliday junction branch migration protein RuvA [Phormidium sp. CCY1219]|uniref:Holliday junction branch migration protein RuvA n=1 Tax=Phormidium sp. CCY1219 TaxID=2886104 RepID=UPI002D1F7538|nr:Holliday junction branch migration protein RuvA [Phormidium sp. CCY1219]MEB3826444.1 Holliday junction branch migration protein RuvA [Phormidium sp. CCY1219]
MIGYLKGTVAGVVKNTGNRVFLSLEVNQVGYDLQIVPRMVQQLPAIGESVQVFTHLQVREDQMVLYGFSSYAERDLFRQLIGVSGIGSQLAIALLDTLEMSELVQAIVRENTRLLAKAPGVGKKTAERICLELRTKLAEWRKQVGLSPSVAAGLKPAVQEDVEMTLLALGYTSSEVMQALSALSEQADASTEMPVEEWIRRAIASLSEP